MANGLFGGGNGTTTAPYLVEDWEDLRAIQKKLSSHYKQVNDIDASELGSSQGWDGIGSSASPFTGSYEGQGYKISNLYRQLNNSNKNSTNYLYKGGLFNYIDQPSVVQNIHLDNATLRYEDSATSTIYINMGLLAFDVAGTATVKNIVVTNGLVEVANTSGKSLSDSIKLSALVCQVDRAGVSTTVNSPATIESCTVEADVLHLVGSSTGSVYLSGICSSMYSGSMVVKDCHFKGRISTISSSTYSTIAGIGVGVYMYDCTVTDSTLECSNGGEAYGVTWQNGGEFKRCHSFNNTIIGGKIASGLLTYGTTEHCSVIGCSIRSKTGVAGGVIVGTGQYSSYTIRNCLVKDCDVTGYSSTAGMAYNELYLNAYDCAVVDTSVVSTNASSCGMFYTSSSSYACTVERCLFSGSVVCNGARLAGILSTTHTDSKVLDSFFLGDYLKGLGGKTANHGRISSMAFAKNARNYSLDTSEIILE